MPAPNAIAAALQRASIPSTVTKFFQISENYWMYRVGHGAPTGTPNALIYIDLDATTASTKYYNDVNGAWVVNYIAGATPDFGATGIKTDVITESTSSAGITISKAVTASENITLAASKTLAVTDADKLTVGGVILPQNLFVAGIIMPHASLTTRDLFYADAAYQVVSLTATPLLVEGGARTAVISKAAGTTAPASATTPLHSGSIDCNATAYTPQVLSLTATPADLLLAATNRIGITFNAAMATGVLGYTIRFKRV